MATSTKAKKTSAKKTSGKAKKSARSSTPSTRAQAPKPAPATKKANPDFEADEPDLASEFPVRSLGHWKSHGGRPKDTPDVWTKAHLAEVAGWIRDYADEAQYPSVAEFCMVYGINHGRLGEFDELREAREYLHAKVFVQGNREAMTATKETSPRVQYINKRLANTGPYSLVEKRENLDVIELPKIVIAEDK